jgi:chromosome segregation protein
MRLNRLEISGFKSFPDRADLVFDRGVTAIVGPNGCGKSNVVDAITWVLGEQSAKSLRGERMDDVIFSGSDARRPTGAAEVRLRLADVPSQAARLAAARRDPALGDAAAAGPDGVQMALPATEVRDVEIARRLYRSGESEYLIDGEVVRLRDVQDLLMDGGLGVRGYAVIEQGKIGQILSAKPTDRRVLIEEAAGVTKYKSRRRAAELKLEAAQQNLARVEDVLFEIDKQRTSLKRQAAKARRYRKLREELRRWEKVLFARRHRALLQSIEAARARLAEARDHESAVVAALVTSEQQLDAARGELSAAEAAATAAREAAHERQLGAERRQQQLAFDRQQLAALAESITRLAEEAAHLEARRAPVLLETEQRRAAAAEAEQARAAAAGRLAEEEAALAGAQRRVQDAERDVDDARRQAFANSTTIATLHNVMDRAREAVERLSAEMARLDVETSDHRVEGDRVAADRDRSAERLAQLQAAISGTGATREAGRARLEGARADRDARRQDVRAKEREVAALEARLRSLEELEAARAGYGDAARAILADASGAVRHAGAVADLVEVEPAYERAVEACLADLLQFVLVDSAEEAWRGLEHVRQRNLGRCGFLVTGGEVAPDAVAGTPPVEGALPLASLMRVAGPLAVVVRGAIGEAWVVERFDEAMAASQLTPAAVVTKAGEVFRHGRLVTGGGRDEGLGLLATKRELRQLRDRVAVEHDLAHGLAGQLAGADQAIAALEAEIAQLGVDLHDHEKAAIASDVEVKRAGDDLARLARRLELVATERRRAEEERRAQQTRHDEAQASVALHEERQRDFEVRIDATQRHLAAVRDELAVVSSRVAEAKATHAALVERASALLNEVTRLEESGRDLEQRHASRVAEHESSLVRRATLDAAILTGARRLDEDQAALDAARTEVRLAEEAVAEGGTRFQRADQEMRRARQLVDDARVSLAQLDVARVTAESDLAHLADSCAEVLQLSLDEVAGEVEQMEALGAVTPDASVIFADEDEEAAAETDTEQRAAPEATAGAGAAVEQGQASEAALHAERARGLHAHALTAEEAIAELRAKIDRLGPVNMMAIEQFDELEQRHTFLTAQRQDLVESIAQTGEAIRKIDRTTRERFQEAFTAITRYFEEMFQTLFGGGRAGLLLIDESDLLESGIDIVAQPPGKRLQNVQLLSGGEKALTAMALMFAIFRYRPSPFCLLDEIDAPLDDANIARFIDMLRGMQAATQFILITHHRKTMEIADRLYGVTMEEPGVSKLISLRLN